MVPPGLKQKAKEKSEKISQKKGHQKKYLLYTPEYGIMGMGVNVISILICSLDLPRKIISLFDIYTRRLPSLYRIRSPFVGPKGDASSGSIVITARFFAVGLAVLPPFSDRQAGSLMDKLGFDCRGRLQLIPGQGSAKTAGISACYDWLFVEKCVHKGTCHRHRLVPP